MPFLGTTGGGSVKQYGGLANLGYLLRNSLRFRSSASAYLNRTFATPTSSTKWTWSGWFKFGYASTYYTIFDGGSPDTRFGRDPNTNQLYVNSDTTNFIITTPVYRDYSSWYHAVLAFDSSQGTASNRLRLYINGSEVTAFATDNRSSISGAIGINTATAHGLGRQPSGGSAYFDGYLTEVNFIDGQQLTPSSFGKTDGATGQWIPKKFAGTYGTNGFYLKFADASAATAAAIGKDSSPNGNNWTPNNISVTAGVTYDAMMDSPTLSAVASNYATWNPLNAVQSTLSQGNLYSSATGGSTNVLSTFPTATTGKWYMEIVLDFTVNINWPIVMGASDGGNTYLNLYTDWSARAINKSVNGTTSSVTPSGNFPANGDILKIAYDADAGKLWLGLNSNWYGTSGSLTGDPATGADATLSGATGKQIYPWHSNAGGPAQNAYLNCGQRPFAYTPPTGFKSLNTYNLP